MTDKFTLQDAQNLIACAQAAPLQNFRAAMELNALIQRAQAFFNDTLIPKPVKAPVKGAKSKEPDPAT